MIGKHLPAVATWLTLETMVPVVVIADATGDCVWTLVFMFDNK